MTLTTPRMKAHISAFLTIVIWATTYISTKVLLADFSPTEITFYRFLLALLALYIMQPKGIRYKNVKEELLFAAAGMSGLVLYFMLQNTALLYTFASNAAVLVSVAPFFIAILSRFALQGEPFHKSFFVGFVISIFGIALISFNGNFILQLNPLGDILTVCSALAWAIYSVILKKISALEYEIIPCTRKIFFYGTIFLLPILPFFDFHLKLDRLIVMPNLLNLLFLGLGASALCFVTWNYALGILGAVRTSVYIYMIPIITVVFSAIVLRETITWVAAAGVALILTGLFVSEDRTKSVKGIDKSAQVRTEEEADYEDEKPLSSQ